MFLLAAGFVRAFFAGDDAFFQAVAGWRLAGIEAALAKAHFLSRDFRFLALDLGLLKLDDLLLPQVTRKQLQSQRDEIGVAHLF